MPQILNTYLTFVNAPENTSTTAQTSDSLFWIVFALFAILIISTCVFIYFKKKDHRKFIIGGAVFALSFLCMFVGVKAFASYNPISVDAEINTEVDSNAASVKILPANIQKNCNYDVSVNSFSANYCEGIDNFKNTNWNIKLGDTLLYEGKFPAQVDTSIVLNAQNNLVISADALDVNTAKSLINQHIVNFSFEVDQVNFTQEFNLDMPLRNLNYGTGYYNLGRDIAINYSADIDNSTKNKCKSVLDSKALSYSETSEGTAKLLVGTNASWNASFEFFQNKNNVDENVLAQADGYQISVDENTIAIIGDSSSACFYALTTLDDIFNCVDGVKLRCFEASDYANVADRGVIEGFYGTPFSWDARIDMTSYMGQFKMNKYVYAPKDDPYHNAQWRVPYPSSGPYTIGEMARLQNNCETNHINLNWCIHPFMNDPIRFDSNYEADLGALLNKFEQLYGVGVRSFSVLADDADGDATKIENQVRLVKDVNDWIHNKSDCAKLMFCPKVYTEFFDTDDEAHKYLAGLKDIPNDVEIFWTGDMVFGCCSESTIEYFTSRTGHQPYMWINYPSNDWFNDFMNLGQIKYLRPGVSGFTGLVHNAMNQPQASKSATYQTAYYTWHGFANDDEAKQAWVDSWKYIDAAGCDALRIISQHSNFCWTQYHCQHKYAIPDESENMTDTINACSEKIDADTQIDEASLTDLTTKYTEVANAVASYKANHSNVILYNEILPWLNQMEYLYKASLNGVEALRAYYRSDLQTAKQLNDQAKADYATSKTFMIPMYDGSELPAATGVKYTAPFIIKLTSYLDGKLTEDTSAQS